MTVVHESSAQTMQLNFCLTNSDYS